MKFNSGNSILLACALFAVSAASTERNPAAEEFPPDLNQAEEARIQWLRNTQSSLLEKNRIPYKEHILLLYPNRSLLYLAQPVLNAKAVRDYLADAKKQFRELAHSAYEDFTRYYQETEEYSYSFTQQSVMLFEMPFIGKKLRILRFKNEHGTAANSGYTESVLFYIKNDGSLLKQDIIFRDRSSALFTIAQHMQGRFAEQAGNQLLEQGRKANGQNYQNIAFNQNRDLLVYFEKYQIAPGSEGRKTFIIPYKIIKELLSDTMRELLEK